MKKIDYRPLAKAVISNRASIRLSIAYLLQKADDDLKKLLEQEGYLKSKETLCLVTALETLMEKALEGQKKRLLTALKTASNEEQLQTVIRTFLEEDSFRADVERFTEEAYKEQVPVLADAYIKDVTSGLRVSRVRLRTSAWMTSWSQQLAELTQLTTETNIQRMLEQLNETGQNNVFSAARDILKEDWRDSYSRARQYALTEALRIHSVAHEEAIQQNPVVTQKEWRHSGGHKNTPRQNHVDMNGQRVSKDKPFTLLGGNGSFYAPMFPRDPSLPPAESVNCHCIHRAVVNPAMEKLPLEELEQMQEQFIREDDESYKPLKSPVDNTLEVGIMSDEEIIKYNQYALSVVDRYVSIPSLWSGNTICKKIKEMPNAYGTKEWNCDISIREDADKETFIHEHLHAKSISYYDSSVYVNNTRIEEGTVEFLARQICKEEGIPYSTAPYSQLVDVLSIINQVGKFYNSDLEFGQALIAQPVPDRFAWLRQKADDFLASGTLSSKKHEIGFNAMVEYMWGSL